jgi:hypothetical protein
VSAAELRQRIYHELGAIVPMEANLEHSYIRLGNLLAAFKHEECWRELPASNGQPYANFDAFMYELRDLYHRGRTQLWAYLSVAEKLLPLVDAETLDKIGISKAQELKRALAPGRVLTPEIIDVAANPKTTIKELRATLYATFNITDDNRPVGQWFDFGGAYLTPDERKEFIEFVKVASAILCLKRETADWIQRKECLMAAAREFLGTHAAEVYGPGVEQNVEPV